MFELGRVDICVEVFMLSSSLAMPREVHLHQLFHIFAYLKKHHNTKIVFDLSVPDFDAEKFQHKYWSQNVYSDAPLDQPPNMPDPRGQGLIISEHVNIDHAGETVTRRSINGFFIYCNNALVYWMSKKQGSIETSSFGSEFLAMKYCMEYIQGIKFKLHIMGIQCDCPIFIYGYNQSILANKTMPHSMMNKKSNSIA